MEEGWESWVAPGQEVYCHQSMQVGHVVRTVVRDGAGMEGEARACGAF